MCEDPTGNSAWALNAIRTLKEIVVSSHTSGRGMFFIQRPPSTIKVQKGGGTKTNLITSTKVCAKQTLVDDNDNTLHALFHNQPTFKAGQIFNPLSEWGNKTSDPTILEFVKGVRIEFTPVFSPEQDSVRSSVFNHVQQAIVAKEIETFPNKGVIKPSCQEPGEFISPIFLWPKPDGTYRMILNLRAFNECVQYHHFKMDTLETAINMMTPGCFIASIDRKDAYCTVPISTDHKKNVKFIFDGSLYQYTCLPNGLSCAPRVFTKLLKPVYTTLHNLGYLSLGYIDDSYLQGDTSSECLENVNCTASLFKKQESSKGDF